MTAAMVPAPIANIKASYTIASAAFDVTDDDVAKTTLSNVN